ncbi:copper transporter 1A isoform X5 [Lycorma delicatula]|uniref:copper transporter 1A isoform X5 n=1 Tax=Lycorma delicatula TaxID=130591 RepID=UPI003F515B0D
MEKIMMLAMSHDHHNHDAHMDHHMDHGSMDRHKDNMNMPENNSSGHMCHMMMSMFFHFGNNETILFESWKVTTVYGLIGSMIGICIMAALYEGLKYYREHLFWSSYNALQYRSVQMPVDKSSSERVVQPSIFSKMHAFQTCLHVIQMVISYFLMLIFMTYNVYLCIAVVIGAGIGYFLFGWKKSVIVDVTEHCH